MDAVHVAFVGCAHGNLDTIYRSISELETSKGINIDLLIVCGDFQSVRNQADLASMVVPPEHRVMGDFVKYYHGKISAPVLTLFIGGNHEASNYLCSLPFGGWAAPNIYYLGYAGVVQFGGLRIAGFSGIFHRDYYNLPHYEKPPFESELDHRSATYVRSVDILRLSLLTGNLDVFLSHDWPAGIWNFGDARPLVDRKPIFQLASGSSLGIPPAMDLLRKLQPAFWVSAHHHVHFSASVPHPRGFQRQRTRFTALDKCAPGNHFMEVISFGSAQAQKCLSYDLEWLAILRETCLLDHSGRSLYDLPTAAELSAKLLRSQAFHDIATDPLVIPSNFSPSDDTNCENNPQTVALCRLIGIQSGFLSKINP